MKAKTCVLRLEKLSGINAKLLHARNQCGPVDCHPRGSTVPASNTTLCLAQDAHDLLPFLLVMFLGCTSRRPLADFANRFSHNPGNVVLLAVVAWNGAHSRFAQFCDRHLERLAARQDYRTLD